MENPNTTLPPVSPMDHRSPSPPRLRHRPLARAATFADPSQIYARRRSSLISENPSDIRRSLRSSTDNLLLPRADETHRAGDTSHWHSVPLGLALLPAVAGLVFKDGGAIVTDITLLGLAAIFLNWSVRLPWDWYRSAQAVQVIDRAETSSIDTIVEEEDDENQDRDPVKSEPSAKQAGDNQNLKMESEAASARKELQVHEMLALLSCFAFPAVGAWLLHAVRGQLSRPSEGLVSNYNLTVFLLAAEIRPISHLVTMIQSRTLFLQRAVSQNQAEGPKIDHTQVSDLAQRLEELEAHISESAEALSKAPTPAPEDVPAKAITQAVTESRKFIQPELDALNRAVRRYEKRTTISSLQTESRLQDLESRLKDVVVLAAAAQRNADSRSGGFSLVLLNWLCAVVVVPVQVVNFVVSLPLRAVQWAAGFVKAGSVSRSSRVESRRGKALPPRSDRRSKLAP